jgi:hypothetical protein
MTTQMAAGDHPHHILLTNSNSRTSLTPHIQNLINLVGLPIGMIFRQIIVNLLLVSRLLKTRGLALVGVEETEPRHSEVAPQVLSPIFMSKTNRRFHLLIIKLLLLVEAEASLEEEEDREVDLHILQGVVFGDAAVLFSEEIKISAVGEEVGEIGTRSVSSASLASILTVCIDQPHPGVFSGHLSTMVYARGD